MSDSDSKSSAAKPLDQSILDVLAKAKGTLSAPEIARFIRPDGDWHALLPQIRHEAVKLAGADKLVIYRKGKPVDPSDFRGVYRLGLPTEPTE